jgi:phosphoserine phosphatase
MKYRTVVFDCDSTLSAIEGIEELAREHHEEIARLTDLAMQGSVPLQQVYGRRLELIRPPRAEVERVGGLYVANLVPGAEAVVRELLARGVQVHILSGGLAPAVRVLARHLGLTDEQVTAVEVRFDATGAYQGFDPESLLARAGGKRAWLEREGERLPRPRLLVGDGATDLEARPAVDAFAAFTGVVHRERIAAAADLVIEGPSLAPLLAIVLGRPGPEGGS